MKLKNRTDKRIDIDFIDEEEFKDFMDDSKGSDYALVDKYKNWSGTVTASFMKRDDAGVLPMLNTVMGKLRKAQDALPAEETDSSVAEYISSALHTLSLVKFMLTYSAKPPKEYED